MPTPEGLLLVARRAAAVAAEIISRHAAQGVSVRHKPDRSPVTDADVEAERAIRGIIRSAFPDHAIYGEELGHDALDAEHLWLVDPIDGTKSFVRGYPMYSTQICVWRDGEALAAVSSAPWFGEVAWATRSGGAFIERTDGPARRLRVSEVESLDRAAISTGNLASLARSDGWQRFGALVAKVDRIRGYGDFWQYHLLAGGHVDAVIESDVNILDVAALALIVDEAGGTVTGLDGRPLTLETRDVLASNTRLHPALRVSLDSAEASERRR